MRRCMLCVIVALIVAMPAFGAVTLVRDGEPAATIIHFGQQGCQHAAEELQRYIHAMTGAVLDIRFMSPQEAETAYWGGEQLLGLALGEETMRRVGFNVPDLQAGGFYQMSDGMQLVGVLGNDPDGLMYGVYDLLEQWGVRWYMPGELGEQIPQMDTLRVTSLDNAENPDFILRDMWLAHGDRPGTEDEDYELWRMRNKMGGVNARMGHNLARIISPDEYAETHPEYFPLIEGERVIPEWGHDWQPCTSNPDVVGIAAETAAAAFDADPLMWAFSLSPNEGPAGWCQCENCTALDPPAFRDDPTQGKGRRMLVFANQVAERLAETHPNAHVAFAASGPTAGPPDDLSAHPQVAVAVAHEGEVADHLRPITDPASPRNAAYIPLVEGWSEVTDQLFAGEHFTGQVDAADGLARVAAAWALAEDIPWYHEHSVIGITSSATSAWGNCGPNFYLAAKLMWDADTDVEAVLDDYFAGMYGPAAEPMREYFETLRDIARERHLQTELLTEEDLPPLRALLDRALELAETEKQQARVQLSIDHFEYVLLVRRMHETASEEDIAALEAFVDAHSESLGFDRAQHRQAVAPRGE